MNYSIKTGDLSKIKTACLILGVFTNKQLTQAAADVDSITTGGLTRYLKRGDFSGKVGQTQFVYELANMLAQRVLLIGLGPEGDFDHSAQTKAIQACIPVLDDSHSTEAVLAVPVKCKIEETSSEIYRDVRNIVMAAEVSLYQFNQCKSSHKTSKRPLKKLGMHISNEKSSSSAKKAINHGKAIADAVSMTKDLANLPGNICTPTYLSNEAKKLGQKSNKLKVTILDEKAMAKLGMGALLSVSRGSRQPAKFIIMEYSGGKAKTKPVVLVGKGLTFDAGGISLKQAASMDEMKYDMCGGASVLGAVSACIDLGLPINLIGIVPSSENLPDGDANKPGDIVTSMSGQTIEILNTDAEGRLILCDALTYAERYEPDVVIDLATLTGACIVALGHQTSGLLANTEKLANDLLEAGKVIEDKAWQLPLWDEYQQQLDSNFADMANIGGKGAGTITAACFLSRYTKKFRWAHLDIAGTAWVSGDKKGATGRPVPLLMQFLLNRCRLSE